MKQIMLTGFLLIAISGKVPAGVYRHDVPVKAYKELAARPQFNCTGMVLKVHDEKRQQAGSCVLIGGRFVLSAAHVFIEEEYRQDTVVYKGKQTILYQPVNTKVGNAQDYYFRFNGKDYKGQSMSMFPGYADKKEDGFDLVVITLERPVKGVQPATLNLDTDELHATVVGVGYGASGIANKPESVKTGSEKIAGENRIDKIEGKLYKGTPSQLMCDFDHPQHATDCNKMGDGTPLPLEYISSGGDSGGGLFRQKGHEWQLVGILTGGGTDIDQLLKTGYYGQIMLWTRVSLFHEWIQQQMH